MWYLKHREKPETKLKRIQDDLENDMERINEAIHDGDTVNIAGEFARLRGRIRRETAGTLHPRKRDRKNRRGVE